VYQGKALVNSVTGERERLDAILPLVKRHGAAVIALPNEEDEIPEDPRKRLDITRKILDIAVGEYEIALEDIVIDPLAMPVGADSSLVCKTFETIALIRDEFGLNMTLGASNVSFGMPRREHLGAAFVPMAMSKGLITGPFEKAVSSTRTARSCCRGFGSLSTSTSTRMTRWSCFSNRASFSST